MADSQQEAKHTKPEEFVRS